jgi:hypothetical protein
MKAVLVILLIIVGIVIGAYLYLTHNMAYQPDWYNPDEAPALAEQMRKEAPQIEEKIQRRSKNNEVSVSAEELSTLIYKQASKIKEHNLHKAVKAVHSEIDPEKVTIEVIIDINQIPHDELPASIKKTVDKLISVLPQKALSNLCVTIEGSPYAKDGKLILDENATVKAAGISIPVREMMAKLKISPAELEKLNLKEFSLQDNQIIFKQ